MDRTDVEDKKYKDFDVKMYHMAVLMVFFVLHHLELLMSTERLQKLSFFAIKVIETVYLCNKSY